VRFRSPARRVTPLQLPVSRCACSFRCLLSSVSRGPTCSPSPSARATSQAPGLYVLLCRPPSFPACSAPLGLRPSANEFWVLAGFAPSVGVFAAGGIPPWESAVFSLIERSSALLAAISFPLVFFFSLPLRIRLKDISLAREYGGPGPLV